MKIDIVSANRPIDRYSHESFKEIARNEYAFLTYLACPYSHPSSKVMEYRYRKVSYVSGILFKNGYNVYSPISHCHPIAKMVGLPTDWEFWQKIDRQYISISKELLVLCLYGWESSKGVSDEIEIAREFNIPIKYITKFDGNLSIETTPY